MERMRIESRKNERVKIYKKLSQSASERARSGEFTAEGARLCADAARSGVRIKSVFYTVQALEKYRPYLEEIFGRAESACEISEPVAEALRDVRSSQEVFCILSREGLPSEGTLSPEGLYIAAERIQDPSNLGALFRTAEALGISGVILSDDCCDRFSPKALRASMGSVFRLPVQEVKNLPASLRKWGEQGFFTFAAVPDQNAESVLQCRFAPGSITVIGNEGSGLTEETIRACRTRVTIPMRGRAESLNASAAAMILMWEMMREPGMTYPSRHDL